MDLPLEIAIVTLLGLLEALSQAYADTDPGEPNYNYNYKSNYNGNSYNYDYSNPGSNGNNQDYGVIVEPPEPKPMQCYDCTYHLMQGSPSGSENCRHHFRSDTEIHTVDCDGECVIAYQMLDSTNYMFSRHCEKDCKNMESSTGYRRCCLGNLCNMAARTHIGSSLLLVAMCLVGQMMQVLLFT